MGDQGTGGQPFVNQYLQSTTTGSSTQPPPGSPSLPLPVVGQVATTGEPPNYKTLGAGQAQADFASAAANGGWKFEPAAMAKVIKEIDQTLHTDLRTARNEAANLVQVRAPGSEVGSQGYAATAKNSGVAYQQFLDSAVNYLTAYRDKLQEISDAYQRQDQAALDALRGTGKAD